MSYYILEESQELKVRLTLLPICLGVTLIVCGELSLNLLGFVSAFAANLSSASRIVFYKSKLKDSSTSTSSSSTSLLSSSSSSSSSTPSTPVSAFTTYLNVGFVSLCVYLPFYTLQTLVGFFLARNERDTDKFVGATTTLDTSFMKHLDYLAYGSLFNFMYNLFSLRVLSKVAPISHSVINIMKRVFIVFCSMAVFSTRVTSFQWAGMLCADCGVFLYSLLKIKSQPIKVNVSAERKAAYKKLVVNSVLVILFACCFVGLATNNSNSSNGGLITKTKILDRNELRIKCIQNIKSKKIS